MGILTDDMRRMVDEQQLGFIATVCPDGTPNLSAKGTTAAWDDEHLVFADICSPGTIANLRHNAVLEINVVDSLLRKGYRFKPKFLLLRAQRRWFSAAPAPFVPSRCTHVMIGFCSLA